MLLPTSQLSHPVATSPRRGSVEACAGRLPGRARDERRRREVSPGARSRTGASTGASPGVIPQAASIPTIAKAATANPAVLERGIRFGEPRSESPGHRRGCRLRVRVRSGGSWRPRRSLPGAASQTAASASRATWRGEAHSSRPATDNDRYGIDAIDGSPVQNDVSEAVNVPPPIGPWPVYVQVPERARIDIVGIAHMCR